MTVLSLFDGMSCGQIALCKLGVTPAGYYASEIDKWGDRDEREKLFWTMLDTLLIEMAPSLSE